MLMYDREAKCYYVTESEHRLNLDDMAEVIQRLIHTGELQVQDHQSCETIGGSGNLSIYTDGETMVLRVHRNGVHNCDDPAAIDFV